MNINFCSALSVTEHRVVAITAYAGCSDFCNFLIAIGYFIFSTPDNNFPSVRSVFLVGFNTEILPNYSTLATEKQYYTVKLLPNLYNTQILNKNKANYKNITKYIL